MPLLTRFLNNRSSAPSLASLENLPVAGKTILISGASRGIGFEAARHYVALGAARVILAVRSQAAGERARDDIVSSTGNIKVHIDVWPLDLASFQSVRQLADRVSQEPASLDIAILNAAVIKREFQVTEDGWEETTQVNVLSTALLSLLLLPKLRDARLKTKDARSLSIPRLVIVASEVHTDVSSGFQAQLPGPDVLLDLNNPELFGVGGPGGRYNISKLLTVYVAREVARLAVGANGEPDVVVTYACPGICASDLPREFSTSFMMRSGLRIMNAMVAKTVEEGSRTLLKGSFLGPEDHGQWFHNDGIEEPGQMVISEEGRALQEKVWTEIVQVLGFVDARVKEIAGESL